MQFLQEMYHCSMLLSKICPESTRREDFARFQWLHWTVEYMWPQQDPRGRSTVWSASFSPVSLVTDGQYSDRSDRLQITVKVEPIS